MAWEQPAKLPPEAATLRPQEPPQKMRAVRVAAHQRRDRNWEVGGQLCDAQHNPLF